jgi:hypothetical protein
MGKFIYENTFSVRRHDGETKLEGYRWGAVAQMRILNRNNHAELD